MGLRSFLDKIKPQFSAGGRYSKLHSTFDAFETFLYTPSTVTRSGAHIRDAVDMKRTMIAVIVALLPALIFGMYNVGLQHVLMRGGTDTSFWPLFGFGFLSMLPTIIVSYRTRDRVCCGTSTRTRGKRRFLGNGVAHPYGTPDRRTALDDGLGNGFCRSVW